MTRSLTGDRRTADHHHRTARALNGTARDYAPPEPVGNGNRPAKKKSGRQPFSGHHPGHTSHSARARYSDATERDGRRVANVCRSPVIWPRGRRIAVRRSRRRRRRRRQPPTDRRTTRAPRRRLEASLRKVFVCVTSANSTHSVFGLIDK